MIIHLISVGTKMPRWVQDGFQEYAKRMPSECKVKLKEIPMSPRGKNCDIPRAIREEGEKMLKAIPKDCHVVALEVTGKSWSTEQLSKKMGSWMGAGHDVALLIGGPDGLSMEATQNAHTQWSLSPLTLPHPMVRVILSEQLYRAWSLLRNHPYHRA